MATFSIRDLLLLTLVVGLAIGWFLDRSKLAEENKQFRMQSGVDWVEALEQEIKNNPWPKHAEKLRRERREGSPAFSR